MKYCQIFSGTLVKYRKFSLMQIFIITHEILNFEVSQQILTMNFDSFIPTTTLIYKYRLQ